MTGTNWYSDIVKSLANIPPAIAHYESELEQARREVGLHGKIKVLKNMEIKNNQ